MYFTKPVIFLSIDPGTCNFGWVYGQYYYFIEPEKVVLYVEVFKMGNNRIQFTDHFDPVSVAKHLETWCAIEAFKPEEVYIEEQYKLSPFRNPKAWKTTMTLNNIHCLLAGLFTAKGCTVTLVASSACKSFLHIATGKHCQNKKESRLKAANYCNHSPLKEKFLVNDHIADALLLVVYKGLQCYSGDKPIVVSVFSKIIQ